MTGFVILCLVAGIFIGIGISCLLAKKAIGLMMIYVCVIERKYRRKS